MNKYAICFLVHNTFYFETLCKNMPKQTNIDLLIFTDLRVCDIRNDILRIAKNNEINIKLFTNEDIAKTLKTNLKLNEQGIKYYDEFKMSLNIILPPFVFKNLEYMKVLLLDDDVIINKDCYEIFEDNEYAFTKQLMGKNCAPIVRKEMCKIYALNEEKWIKNYISNGHRLYTHSNTFTKMYIDMLKSFFESETLYNAYMDWVNGTSKTNGFFQDMHFENCVCAKLNLYNNKMHEYVRSVFTVKNLLVNKNLYINKHILHYACGDGGNIKSNPKEWFVKMLKNENVIK